MNAMQEIGPEPIRIASAGAELTGTLYRPAGTPKAAIVLHGATGVPHRYYRHFAAWLADEGYACLTYDYRDFGASAAGHAKRSKATMVDWGLHDQSAAQQALEAAVPGAPVWVIGHSLGGFMLPFQPGAARVERLIAVASGPVHTSDHALNAQIPIRIFWSRPVAALTRALGYLPGKMLGLGPDIPSGVYAQWRRWCTTRGFYRCDIGTALPQPDWSAFRGRAKFVVLDDDNWMTAPAVWRLMQHYPEAIKRQLTLRPKDHGLGKVGHVAAFSPKNKALWPAILA